MLSAFRISLSLDLYGR